MHVPVPIMSLLLLSSCTEPNPYLGICDNGVHEPEFDEECDDGAGNGDAAECSMTCQLATDSSNPAKSAISATRTATTASAPYQATARAARAAAYVVADAQGVAR